MHLPIIYPYLTNELKYLSYSLQLFSFSKSEGITALGFIKRQTKMQSPNGNNSRKICIIPRCDSLAEWYTF